MPRLNPVFENLSAYPIAALEAKKRAIAESGVRIFDFGTGDPREPTAEFIREALLAAVQPRCGYPVVRGRIGVRQAIADYLERRFSVSVDPDTQVLPTAGAKEAVFHMPLLVIDKDAPDNLVIFPDPGYPAYQRGALFAGGMPYPVVLEDDHVFRPWLLPTEVLQRARLMWINTPHNPSGAVTSLADLQRTADTCREHDILLASDETYVDIYQGDEAPHSVLECGSEGLIVLHSLSKRSGMTGYRSGFMAGDADIMTKLTRLRANPGLVPQDFVNAAAAAAWADDAHVAERRELFTEKKKLFLDFFDDAGLHVVGRSATIYLWLKVPEGYTAVAWADRLLAAGIVVSPGPMFGVSGAGAGYVRLALVPSMSVCREAIAVWRTLL